MSRLRTVAEWFARYRAEVLDPEIAEPELAEYRRAFYAGAYFMLLGAMAQAGDFSQSTEDYVRAFLGVKQEIEAFAEDGGIPAPSDDLIDETDDS